MTDKPYKKDIMAELDKLGIEYDSNDRKAELAELLENSYAAIGATLEDEDPEDIVIASTEEAEEILGEPAVLENVEMSDSKEESTPEEAGPEPEVEVLENVQMADPPAEPAPIPVFHENRPEAPKPKLESVPTPELEEKYKNVSDAVIRRNLLRSRKASVRVAVVKAKTREELLELYIRHKNTDRNR